MNYINSVPTYFRVECDWLHFEEDGLFDLFTKDISSEIRISERIINFNIKQLINLIVILNSPTN